MNLIKNVDEDWSVAKGRVRQDLDTIQRAMNAVQAQLDALSKKVNTVVPTPAAVITPANTVTTFGADYLRSVATKPGSGLTGKGTVTDPLGLTLSSTVSVAAAGALSGDGSSGSPLAVKVDGTTIQINGSNQLTASIGSNLFYALVNIPVAAYRTLFSAPVTLVAAPGAGKYLVPVAVTYLAQKPVGSITNASPTVQFLYGGILLRFANDITPNFGAGWAEWFINNSGLTGSSNSTTIQSNVSFILTAGADMGAGSTITSVNVGLLYVVETP